MALTERQMDALTPEARHTLDVLGAMREGRTMNELAERLADAVNAVLEHLTVSEKGRVSGPKATVTLVLEVAPNQYNYDATVSVSERVTSKKPEDREHTLYVGKGGTLHVHDPRAGLFAVRSGPSGETTFDTRNGTVREPDGTADVAEPAGRDAAFRD